MKIITGIFLAGAGVSSIFDGGATGTFLVLAGIMHAMSAVHL